jgi:hypothetical protein
MENSGRFVSAFRALIAAFAALAFLSAPAFAAKGAPDIGKFSLKNGKVYKNNKKINGEVHKTDAKAAGAAAFWSVFGPEASARTGVWFFSKKGACVKFVPLKSKMDAQDVIVSPGGGAFALEGGSGMRPDVFFHVYSWKSAKKKAELRGVRGELGWLDDNRLGFTRIETDGVRVGRFYGLAYGLKLSAALYDLAAGKESVLKKATETQNFSFAGVSDDGKSIKIGEEYVDSEGDWIDEDKRKAREIKVPISAAG